MLTSHRILQQIWHDSRFDTGYVSVWYIDRGAPGDRSRVHGSCISLEPYYLAVHSAEGEKPVPYHRILLITYAGEVVFENRKIAGRGREIAEEDRDAPG